MRPFNVIKLQSGSRTTRTLSKEMMHRINKHKKKYTMYNFYIYKTVARMNGHDFSLPPVHRVWKHFNIGSLNSGRTLSSHFTIVSCSRTMIHDRRPASSNSTLISGAAEPVSASLSGPDSVTFGSTIPIWKGNNGKEITTGYEYTIVNMLTTSIQGTYSDKTCEKVLEIHHTAELSLGIEG